MKLEDILLQKKDNCTKCCLCKSEYNTDDVRYYDHPGGWDIDGFKEKQWLYFHCHNCQYDWAIRK